MNPKTSQEVYGGVPVVDHVDTLAHLPRKYNQAHATNIEGEPVDGLHVETPSPDASVVGPEDAPDALEWLADHAPDDVPDDPLAEIVSFEGEPQSETTGISSTDHHLRFRAVYPFAASTYEAELTKDRPEHVRTAAAGDRADVTEWLPEAADEVWSYQDKLRNTDVTLTLRQAGVERTATNATATA